MTATEYVIDQMKASDWELVRSIFVEGIATGYTTFETEAPSWEKWDAGHLQIARLVARKGGDILGWSALSPVSGRDAYRGVAELSVSIGEKNRGQGIGRALLEALIKESERNGIWTLQAAIFPENKVSVKLHLRCRFREVGRRERIGRLNGAWRDTLLFERRSSTVGLD
ncbi:MAG TPA: GNAT family N-acetyltransferase [Pyrinomonadaceae bacterium]|nr:GNAT family N-acetyltransferase [Pyrinomonadaceae bacterium]